MKTPIRWSDKEGLIRKYRGRVPRYTSYPPATAFDDAGPRMAAEAYSRMSRKPQDDCVSVYVHLPFCERMCRYCGCAAIASKTGKQWTPYMEHLASEVKLVASALNSQRSLTQLHWGGGTPNWLPPEGATDFFNCLVQAFPLAADAEVATEIDPKTLRPGQLASLRSLGFNRVSFGIQDTNPEVQLAVGRIFPAEAAAEVMAEAHELQFESINIDLMYGLPRQTVESFRQTVQQVASWRPNRISLFGYAHVPWMRPHQRLMPESELPPARERVRLFTTAADLLNTHGYEHLGLDHFVLPCDALAQAKRDGRLYRNFQGYSIRRADDLIGLGMSAIGHVAGSFIANHRTLGEYQRMVSKGRFPTERAYIPTQAERAVADSINEVMCHGVLDFERVSAPFGGPQRLYGVSVVERLETLRTDGLIELDAHSLRVTPAGRFVLRHVAAALDPRLNAVQTAHERFSSGL